MYGNDVVAATVVVLLELTGGNTKLAMGPCLGDCESPERFGESLGPPCVGDGGSPRRIGESPRVVVSLSSASVVVVLLWAWACFFIVQVKNGW